MSSKNENQNKPHEQLRHGLEELRKSNETSNMQFNEKQISSHNTDSVVNTTSAFTDFFKIAPAKMLILDLHAQIVDVNDAWTGTFGYNLSSVKNKPFETLLTEKSAERFIVEFNKTVTANSLSSFVCEITGKSGKQFSIHLDIKPVLDASNLQVYAVSCFDISDFKNAEESNRIKQLAIESAIDAVAISDIGGKITYINPASSKLWGYTPEEVLGHSVVDFMKSTAKTIEIIELIKKNGRWSGEVEAVKKSGETFAALVSALVVNDIQGKPFCMLASFEDITLHKNAERIRLESENSYYELFNNVTDAIYIMNAEGTFLDINAGSVKLYGYSKQELVGKKPDFFSAPGRNNQIDIRSILHQAYNGNPQQFEFWGKKKNGEIFPEEVRVFEGNYHGEKVLIAMAQDITKRKQAEEALLESERKFRELIELAVDGILMGSPEGIIIGANSYMQKLTGRQHNDLIGKNINELFDSEQLTSKPLRYDLLRKGETVFSERTLKRPDGSLIQIEMHTKMMPDLTYQSFFRDVTTRKQTEEILRNSEEKYKSLVENTSDIIWETNTQGLYTYVSPQIETILGYTPEEALGKSPYDFISDEMLDKISALKEDAKEITNPFYLLVNQFKHRDSGRVYFETSGVPINDNEGKLLGYRGVSRDITKRYLAEKEVHKLSLVVEQSPNSIIITNLAGIMEYVNPAACSISGYTMEELTGRNPSMLSSGTTPPETFKSLWDALTCGNDWKGIFHNKKKNGEYYFESAFIMPLREKGGEITHYLGIKEDITKRIEAENALRESEKRYKDLFEGSPDAILLSDLKTGKLIDANPAAATLLNASHKQILQLHLKDIYAVRPSHTTTSYTHSYINNDAIGNQAVEKSIQRSDGSIVAVEVVSNTITIEGRAVLQNVLRDITERRQAREELLKAKEKAEASDRLKSAFLNNISHELRTPLNGIIGFSEMITQSDSSEADRIEFNKMIKKSSSRLINTITSYVDISMIVSGITEINKRPFGLVQFMKSIYEYTVEQCESRNLQLEVYENIGETDTLIETDETLLTKIFSHLIDNAIKFTHEGSITIGHQLKPGHHLFSVTDTGRGISNESASVIFEVFMQADLSTSRGYEGSGLGLSIAQGFVRLLGGEIWVESKNNMGSAFYFSIPVKGAKNNIEPEPVTQTMAAAPVILVAEDDDSGFKYLEIVLKKASYKILRTTNGKDTIEAMQKHPEIGLLITDLKMPGMDGFESTRQIRTIFPNLPIIALSGFTSANEEQAALKAGCNEYMIKPVSKLKLLETIHRLLKGVESL